MNSVSLLSPQLRMIQLLFAFVLLMCIDIFGLIWHWPLASLKHVHLIKSSNKCTSNTVKKNENLRQIAVTTTQLKARLKLCLDYRMCASYERTEQHWTWSYPTGTDSQLLYNIFGVTLFRKIRNSQREIAFARGHWQKTKQNKTTTGASFAMLHIYIYLCRTTGCCKFINKNKCTFQLVYSAMIQFSFAYIDMFWLWDWVFQLFSIVKVFVGVCVCKWMLYFSS